MNAHVISKPPHTETKLKIASVQISRRIEFKAIFLLPLAIIIFFNMAIYFSGPALEC